jgi:integrase
MSKKFGIAVDAVRENLAANRYSYSTTKGYLRCYKLLDEYLADGKKRYDKHLAEEWLQSIAPGLCGSTTKTYRAALKKLDTAYRQKELGNTKAEYDARQNYRRLTPWCKTLLDAFLDEISGAYGRSYIRAIKIASARFLNYLTDKGGCGPEDISHRIVADYYCDDGHESRVSKEAYNNRICKFLQYISDIGAVKSSVPLTLDKFVLPRLVFIESLPNRDRDAFRETPGAETMNAEDYYEKTREASLFIDQHRYSKTAKNEYLKVWKELFVFLEANSLAYSSDVALAWANHMRRYTVQWKSFRRAVMLFEQCKTDGQINPQKIYSYKDDRVCALPAWCRADCEAFLDSKAKCGLAKSTLDMCRSACLRLLEYLSAGGAASWKEVTPERLKQFHRHDPHSTTEGRNAYSSKIRSFLEYLGEKGRVSPTLFMAIPNEYAPRANIVRTLDDDDIEEIYRTGQNAGDASELRGTAMILMGLRMGLRASDITKLKFSDISWGQRTISVQQRKTGKFLKLPMPVEVGNALCRYITEGRPDTPSAYVFISHRVPYSRLHPLVCRKALLNMLPTGMTGFHITRRTFASRMLKHDIGAGRIAETLGHADNSSVMTYLATNDAGMRLCALPIEDIPVKGGVLS